MRIITPAQAQANLDAAVEPDSGDAISRFEAIQLLADWHIDGLDIDELRRIVRDCVIYGACEDLPEPLRPMSNEELEDLYRMASGNEDAVVVP